MAKLPTGELVAVAYGKRVLVDAGNTAPVVTTLPGVDSWSTTGALQVEGIVGTGSGARSGARLTNLRDMIVSFGGWAARPGSDKPPWGQANGLLELIRDSAFRDWSEAWELELEPAGVYLPVLVQGAHPQTEPRRMADPDMSRAHYTMDFRLFWVVL
jgi:hypothetical protein